MKNKNAKIQILRALCIIAVVIVHTSPYGLIQVFIRPFLNFAVPTFLFLSGYLTDLSKIKKKEFYKKRILRVLIPYILWSIPYTTINSASRGLSLSRYVVNILTTFSSSILYYVFVYIQLVLLTPLLGKLLKKKYWYLVFIISPLALLPFYYWTFHDITPNKYINTIWLVGCFRWVIFYYLGLYLKNRTPKKNYDLKKLISLYLFTIIIQMLEGYIWLQHIVDRAGTHAKLSAMLTSAIFILIAYQYINTEKWKGKNKFLVTIGNYSFGIYLSHYLLIDIFSKFLPFWDKIPFGVNSLIIFILSLSIVMLGKRIFGEKISRYLGFY